MDNPSIATEPQDSASSLNPNTLKAVRTKPIKEEADSATPISAAPSNTTFATAPTSAADPLASPEVDILYHQPSVAAHSPFGQMAAQQLKDTSNVGTLSLSGGSYQGNMTDSGGTPATTSQYPSQVSNISQASDQANAAAAALNHVMAQKLAMQQAQQDAAQQAQHHYNAAAAQAQNALDDSLANLNLQLAAASLLGGTTTTTPGTSPSNTTSPLLTAVKPALQPAVTPPPSLASVVLQPTSVVSISGESGVQPSVGTETPSEVDAATAAVQAQLQQAQLQQSLLTGALGGGGVSATGSLLGAPGSLQQQPVGGILLPQTTGLPTAAITTTTAALLQTHQAAAQLHAQQQQQQQHQACIVTETARQLATHAASSYQAADAARKMADHAAAAYHAAALEAQTTTDPTKAIQAVAAAQHALTLYNTATGDAESAEAQASQLSKTAATLAASPAAKMATAVPASLPFAAHIAAGGGGGGGGGILGTTMPFIIQQQQTPLLSQLQALEAPSLTPSLLSTTALTTGQHMPPSTLGGTSTISSLGSTLPPASNVASVINTPSQVASLGSGLVSATTTGSPPQSAISTSSPQQQNAANLLATTQQHHQALLQEQLMLQHMNEQLAATNAASMAVLQQQQHRHLEAAVALQAAGLTGSPFIGSNVATQGVNTTPPLSPTAAGCFNPTTSTLGGHGPLQINRGAGCSTSLVSSPLSPSEQQPRIPGMMPCGSIKVVCSSGGSFVRQGSTGGWEYEGGETRLVSIPYGCSSLDLQMALDRATGPAAATSDSSGLIPHNIQLKYKLPSDESVWVDLVDDDDVAMMFDEWEECLGSTAAGGGKTTTRLHLYVQWRSSSAHDDVSSEEVVNENGNGAPTGDAAIHTSKTDHEVHSTSENTAKESLVTETGTSTLQQLAAKMENDAEVRRKRRQQRRERAALSCDLSALVERMEIIDVKDIKLLKFLGAGGYGDVYLGRWNECECAVKCLNPALFYQGSEGINKVAVLDLIKEADILGSLRHPNVVWVYGLVLPNLEEQQKQYNGECSTWAQNVVDAIQEGAGERTMMPGILRPPALVTEFMAGGSLKNALQRRADIVAGPLTRIVLALDAAKGMDYLHSKNIVHFDFKSGNLLLGYRDRRPCCKVCDFGLARKKSQTFVSGVSSQRGTLPWTAPEVVRTPDAVTEKVDVFSFGIVLWELWTGKEPYEELNYHSLIMQLSNPAVKLRPPIPGTAEWGEGDSPPELAPGYRNLMERCWAENPDDRPSFSDIIKELRAMVQAIKPHRGGSSNRLKAAGDAPQS